MADPDKELEAALKAFQNQVDSCTAGLNKKHDEHWSEVDMLVSEIEKQIATMVKVGDDVKKLIRENHTIMAKHEKDLAALRKKV